MFKTEPLYSSTPASGSSNKNLNNLLADDDEPQGEPPGLIQQILSFFSKLWSPSTSDAEKLGYSYVYAEDGSLLGEYGSGGSNSTGTAQYIYLPTASGPMPIAAVIKGQTYAVHSDHLNTPRKLTQPDGQVAWQWAYSAFGDEQPTIGAKRFTSETTTPTTGATSIPEVTFNLRYPGQYFDKETKLHYNYFRTYAPSMGRYTQGDPIGLDGGLNPYVYVDGSPLLYTDPFGLEPVGHHFVPQSLWRNEPLLPDTRRAFDRATTGPIPGGHNYGDGHNKYNEAVRDMYEKWKTQNKIQCETMTPKQAEDFVRQVKQSTDPRIRDFNNRIYQRIINGAFRRIPGGRGANE